jgi:hypothetical protein
VAVIDPFSAVVAGVTGIFGAVSGASAQSQARAAEQARIDAQYKYDKQNYRFNWQTTKREYNYRVDETNVARQNQEGNLRYLEQTAQNDYKYNLAIRDYDYANQVRQFNESERIYGMQKGFNAMAAMQAQANEDRRYQEILTGMAFDQQDMLVKMLQEDGAVTARGVSGRSAAKSLGSVLAGYGRNQAIAAENLLSAQRETTASSRQIALDRYGADLAAESRRMLKPLRAPAPIAPLAMPRATILDPLKPKKPPKPRKGVNTMPASTGLSIANNFISSGLGSLKWTN